MVAPGPTSTVSTSSRSSGSTQPGLVDDDLKPTELAYSLSYHNKSQNNVLFVVNMKSFSTPAKGVSVNLFNLFERI